MSEIKIHIDGDPDPDKVAQVFKAELEREVRRRGAPVVSEWKDAVITRTRVHLAWWDRLRVLFGGVVVVSVETPTAEEVTTGASTSHAHVERPGWWPKPKPVGYMAPAELPGREP